MSAVSDERRVGRRKENSEKPGLLPHSGGFEGFLTRRIGLEPDDLGRVDCVSGSPTSLEGCPAPPSASSLVVDDYDPILANVDDLRWLQDVVVPRAPVAAKVIDDGILAPQQSRVVGEQPDSRGINLDFPVEHVEEPARI